MTIIYLGTNLLSYPAVLALLYTEHGNHVVLGGVIHLSN